MYVCICLFIYIFIIYLFIFLFVSLFIIYACMHASINLFIFYLFIIIYLFISSYIDIWMHICMYASINLFDLLSIYPCFSVFYSIHLSNLSFYPYLSIHLISLSISYLAIHVFSLFFSPFRVFVEEEPERTTWRSSITCFWVRFCCCLAATPARPQGATAEVNEAKHTRGENREGGRDEG